MHYISGYKAVSSFTPCSAETIAQHPAQNEGLLYLCPSLWEPHISWQAHASHGNACHCWPRAQAGGSGWQQDQAWVPAPSWHRHRPQKRVLLPGFLKAQRCSRAPARGGTFSVFQTASIMLKAVQGRAVRWTKCHPFPIRSPGEARLERGQFAALQNDAFLGQMSDLSFVKHSIPQQRCERPQKRFECSLWPWCPAPSEASEMLRLSNGSKTSSKILT